MLTLNVIVSWLVTHTAFFFYLFFSGHNFIIFQMNDYNYHWGFNLLFFKKKKKKTFKLIRWLSFLGCCTSMVLIIYLFHLSWFKPLISLVFQALFFGGQDNLPSYLARHSIPGLGIVVDPCAAVLILVVTLLLCIGIKEVIFFSFQLLASLCFLCWHASVF
jgi:hypothetical protein